MPEEMKRAILPTNPLCIFGMDAVAGLVKRILDQQYPEQVYFAYDFQLLLRHLDEEAISLGGSE
jgi:hypothetical protein